jgi:hypothetical protein
MVTDQNATTIPDASGWVGRRVRAAHQDARGASPALGDLPHSNMLGRRPNLHPVSLTGVSGAFSLPGSFPPSQAWVNNALWRAQLASQQELQENLQHRTAPATTPATETLADIV